MNSSSSSRLPTAARVSASLFTFLKYSAAVRSPFCMVASCIRICMIRARELDAYTGAGPHLFMGIQMNTQVFCKKISIYSVQYMCIYEKQKTKQYSLVWASGRHFGPAVRAPRQQTAHAACGHQPTTP
jgi:hypothetical protein